jgi:flagellar protein FlgJ
MYIDPLMSSMTGFRSNTTAESATTAADAASFQQTLQAAKDKLATAQQAASSTDSVDKTALTKQEQQLKQACKGFEAMFLTLMYREMRATVPKDPLFGESNAQKIFKDMRDTQLMQNVADAGGLGLADMLYKQLAPSVLKQAQSSAHGAAASKAATTTHTTPVEEK